MSVSFADRAGFGFVRVATASPAVRVADCGFNAQRILAMMERAQQQDVAVLVFPELCLTGYTCADLFHQQRLQQAALSALAGLIEHTARRFLGLAVVGLPLAAEGQLFNCAAVMYQGALLGIVPKSFLPTYREFYERRWFAPASAAPSAEIVVFGRPVPFGTDLLFAADGWEQLVLGVEICEDLWVPQPPSSRQAVDGATVLVNLSGSTEGTSKAAYRRQLVSGQAARCIAAYVYSACGGGESSTDLVFGGHCLIAENGTLLAESGPFAGDEAVCMADIDLERLHADRLRMGSFHDSRSARLPILRRALFACDPRPAPARLVRPVAAHPFVPSGQDDLRERCEEIFRIQVAGLGSRLRHLNTPPVAIGVSGGLDSTLALLVACRTADWLGMPRRHIRAFTMPGYGTTQRTKKNATDLMRQLGVLSCQIDIRQLCLDAMRALGHKPFGIGLDGLSVETLSQQLRQLPPEARHDLVFENVQARMRTSLLMNSAFVIGTGDLSELALGWATYNADHMSMYNPNVGIPKTLVRFLVAWAAEHEFSGSVRTTLRAVLETPISPELLPPNPAGDMVQETEDIVGPYELHDFFLFHFLRYGAAPSKILYLAGQARFSRPYSPQDIRHWLKVFLRRFFASQYKRSCLPDGPKVGSVSLSPRGDWRMPSDAHVAQWLADLEDEL